MNSGEQNHPRFPFHLNSLFPSFLILSYVLRWLMNDFTENTRNRLFTMMETLVK